MEYRNTSHITAALVPTLDLNLSIAENDGMQFVAIAPQLDDHSGLVSSRSAPLAPSLLLGR